MTVTLQRSKIGISQMKYLSIVIVLALMGWTWSLATTERTFKLEQHKQVEAGVEEDVRSFIQRKFPNVSEIYCSQLFTEIIDPGKELVARFRCQAAGTVGEDVAEQIFEGHIQLKSDDEFKTWSETGGEIRSPEVRFRNGIRISPKDGEAAPAVAPTEDASEAPSQPAAPEAKK